MPVTSDGPPRPSERGSFDVHLTNFDGPFDLLLQLIGRRQLDITEVALSQVTDDFIAHLHALFPAASEEAIHDAYLHLVAATMHTYSNNLRLDSLTAGRMHAHDIDERHHALLRFAEGGIIALATASKGS